MARDDRRVRILVHMSGESEETSFLPGREYVLPRAIAERFVEHGVARFTEAATAGELTEHAADVGTPARLPRPSRAKGGARNAQD